MPPRAFSRPLLAQDTLTQRSVDFIQSHTRTVEYFGGVSAVVVPDQLRTGVTDPCRYEPTVQRTYADWARHYGTAIVPARPTKPRDKGEDSYCTSYVA